jgi:acetyl esterase/lipase
MGTVGRRTILRGAVGGLGAVAALSACGAGEEPARGTKQPARTVRSRYGSHPDQFGVLRLPAVATSLPTVALLHGGFWQDDYGLDLMDDLARAVTDLGHPTWNVEYRRLGSGGGWPETFTDVADAVGHLRSLSTQVQRNVAHEVVLLGHSAGGQLAVWGASRTARTPGGRPRVPLRATIALSGVLDLRTGAKEYLGGGTIQALMGGAPREVPEHYRLGDPTALVPARTRVWAVHGTSDIVVPIEQSSAYVAAAREAGGRAELVEVPGEHLDLIDPSAAAWDTIARLLHG